MYPKTGTERNQGTTAEVSSISSENKYKMIQTIVKIPETQSKSLSKIGMLNTSGTKIQIKKAIKIPIRLDKRTSPPEHLSSSFRENLETR